MRKNVKKSRMVAEQCASTSHIFFGCVVIYASGGPNRSESQPCISCSSLGWIAEVGPQRIPNLITGLSGWCTSDEPRRTQETLSDRCKPSLRILGKNSSQCLCSFGLFCMYRFFFSWVSKTQPNHWAKRIATTRLTT